ncbi:transporter substrate-binding domain-containing protein [Desulfobacterales bacterium HSG17]|nr:transporter substrate-binding domain-containing protein [Desulfobacterales bacterium HSG17]
MTKIIFALLITIISFFQINLLNAQNTSKSLPIYYNERPPFFFTNKNEIAQGIVIERVKTVFDKAGVSYKFGSFPPNRLLIKLKKNNERFCTIGWYKNEERQKFAKYSDYIYQNKSRIALASSNNNKIKSGNALAEVFMNRDLFLLVKDGFSYGKFIDDKITKYEPAMKKVFLDNIKLLKLLKLKRADYFFTFEEEADVLIPKAGFRKADFKYVHFSNMPSGLKRYILYSKKVEDDLIKKIDEAIKKYLH